MSRNDGSCGYEGGCGCNGNCAGSCACGGGRSSSLQAPRPRPGLAALDVRIGDHGRFFDAATTLLSAPEAPALQALGTRDPSDPAMALIDAWAVAADVLTFYRERLTNEGYLRCARDERSLRWLAGGVGYKPRPGVAATAWLSYTLDANAAPVDLAAGAKASTTPQGDQQMQCFETLAPLHARAEWSAMSPRQLRMPAITLADALSRNAVKLAGTSTSARPGEKLLFAFGYGSVQQVVREIADCKFDVQRGWVEISLVPRITYEQARKLQAIATNMVKALPANAPAAAVTANEVALFSLSSFFLGGLVSDALNIMNYLLTEGGGGPAIKACVEALQSIASPDPEVRRFEVAASVDSILGQAGTPSLAQAPPTQTTRSPLEGLGASGAQRGALLKQGSAQLGEHLYQAWKAMPAADTSAATSPELFILRTIASPFGAAAPRPLLDTEAKKKAAADWTIEAPDMQKGAAYLDNVFANVSPGSLALVDAPLFSFPAEELLRGAKNPLKRLRTGVAEGNATTASDLQRITHMTRLARVASTQVAGRSDYATNARVTRLDLVDPESGKTPFTVLGGTSKALFTALRDTTYTVQSEAVRLAEEPIDNTDVADSSIHMDSLLEGLEVGRWIVVHGERTDIAIKRPGAPDLVLPVIDGELAQVAGIDQQPYPGAAADTLHTVLKLASPLAFRYRRSTVKIHGNVVMASHGESTSEPLGSGNAATRLQRFEQHRGPLTFLPAVTTSGVQGSQVVRVNGVKWCEVDSLLDAGPTTQAYEMSIDEAGLACYTFGDGVHGARLPTGQANVRAAYRVGIGSAGNAHAGQIDQAVTRPLGVNGVSNPLPASGGADRDGSERIRANVPLAALSLSPLSRLVSVSDYAVFARRYAGIGQAVARKLSDGRFHCVHLTLAGVDDAPLRPDDSLVSSLRAACDEFGDPALPVVIDVRERLTLFVQARFAAAAGHDWDTVTQAVHARMHEAFSFERRTLGQDIHLSEVIAVIQSVAGVEWVDVDMLGGLSEAELGDTVQLEVAVKRLQEQITQRSVATVLRARLAESSPSAPSGFRPAQLACLPRDAAGTLVLNHA
jgi:hypothetical protein